MDWVYLILVVSFVGWSTQMILVYRRRSAQIEAQIDQALRSQEEVSEDVERHEVQAESLKEQLEPLEDRMRELEGKEADLRGQLSGKNDSDAADRPTRHRVDGGTPEA